MARGIKALATYAWKLQWDPWKPEWDPWISYKKPEAMVDLCNASTPTEGRKTEKKWLFGSSQASYGAVSAQGNLTSTR